MNKFSELSEKDLFLYSGGGFWKKAAKKIPYAGTVISGINHAGSIEKGAANQQNKIDKRNEQLKN